MLPSYGHLAPAHKVAAAECLTGILERPAQEATRAAGALVLDSINTLTYFGMAIDKLTTVGVSAQE